MEIIQMNTNTWRIEDGHVRCFLIEGKEKALLIDTGMTSSDAKKLAESTVSKPVELINTHADRDHIAGNGAFEKMYMSPDEEGRYRDNGGKGDIIPVREGDVLDLGERHVKIVDLPGHTPGSIGIIDVENRVLYSGDSVQTSNIFMFGKGRDLPLYVKSLKHLQDFAEEFDVIYPCHGDLPVTKELIGKLIEGAEKILAGEVKGEEIMVHNHPVSFVKFDYAGFYCNPEE